MTYPAKVRCFFCEPSGLERLFLRRYAASSKAQCSGPYSYHNARVFLEDRQLSDTVPTHPRDDERWPMKCAACDYVFDDDDHWQVFRETIYLRTDTGEEVLQTDNVPGMMFDATWMCRKGADGRSLYVILPNGKQWAIDGRASNCSMPEDSEHRCWVRHGEPPFITVDKNGNTCAAGGGSIQAGDYHGFLRNGVFDP